MDSKVVNRQIKETVWPCLRSAGFDMFSPRTAWRHHTDRVDVVNFQSFNSYMASAIECTTYSFAVNLGCFILCIPDQFAGQSRVKSNKGQLMPKEYHCHLRSRLFPTIAQPKMPAKGIWFLDEHGGNLEDSLLDVRRSMQSDAMPWFQQFEAPTEVVRILRYEPEAETLYGIGSYPSPIRHYLIGYVALNLGDHSTARQHLEAALLSGCFWLVQEQLEKDLQRAISGLGI